MHYAVVPMSDLMKISKNTISEVTKEYWPVPARPLQGTKEHDETVASDWERTVHITLVPDETKVSEDVLSSASMILEDMRAMGHEGSKRRRQRQLRQGKRHLEGGSLSISDAFSITSTLNREKPRSRRRS